MHTSEGRIVLWKLLASFDRPVSPDDADKLVEAGFGEVAAGRGLCVWFQDVPLHRFLPEIEKEIFVVREHSYAILCKNLFIFVLIGVEPAPSLDVDRIPIDRPSKAMELLAHRVAQILGRQVAIRTALKHVVVPSPIELWHFLPYHDVGKNKDD